VTRGQAPWQISELPIGANRPGEIGWLWIDEIPTGIFHPVRDRSQIPGKLLADDENFWFGWIIPDPVNCGNRARLFRCRTQAMQGSPPARAVQINSSFLLPWLCDAFVCPARFRYLKISTTRNNSTATNNTKM